MIQSNKIVGREVEKSRLVEMLKKANNGQGGAMFISGEAGIGKTRLAADCLAASGLRVFHGKGVEDMTTPYGLLLSALREYLRQFSADSLMSGPLSGYLALLLPELGTPPQDATHETLLEAIGDAVVAMSRQQPCAIFVDDLQWADNATLELLPFLTGRIEREAVVIVATYRRDEIPRSHRLRWVRNELRRSRLLQEIVLKPLDETASHTLLEQVLNTPPSPKLARLVFEQTQGIPLFIEELTNTLAENKMLHPGSNGLEMSQEDKLPIPESIRDAVLLRMDGIASDSRELLELAAVLGLEFDLDLLMDMASSHRGLDELFEQKLITEIRPNLGGFRHALTREAILSEMTWSRRRALNKRIATHLESKGMPPEAIAEYWLAAKEHEKARIALLHKAEHSCHLHAFRDAANAAYRALEIWPDGKDEERRLEALQRLAHCAQVSGQLSDSIKAWKEVAESPKVQSDPRRLGQVWRALATIYGLQGASENTLRARTAGAEAFEKAKLPKDAAVEWLAGAGKHVSMLHYNSALDYCDRSLQLARQAGRVDVEARALGLRGNVLSMIGESEKGIDAVKAGLSLALQHNLVEAASEVYRRLGSTLEYASDYSGSKAAYSAAFDYCQNNGVDSQANLCLSCMSYILFRIGDWKECRALCKRVMKNPKAPEGSRQLAASVVSLIRAFRGETRSAQKALQQALDFSHLQKVPALELISNWGLATVHQYRPDAQAALFYYGQILEIQQRTQDIHDALPALCAAATFFSELGREEETAKCAEILADMTSATGNHEVLAGLAHALGETALLNQNPKQAIEQFHQAQAQFEKMQVPLDQARSSHRLGVAYARSGAKEPAVRHLKKAYQSMKRIGARPLAARISLELKKLGTPAEEYRSAKAPERADRAGLTGRQIEILTLIGEGLTNKEIADRLYLSPRTVDMHVGHILERLDCRGRVEAVRKAGDLGILA